MTNIVYLKHVRSWLPAVSRERITNRLLHLVCAIGISLPCPLSWAEDGVVNDTISNLVIGFLIVLVLLQAILIWILLRNRKKYKITRALLQQTQHDLEERVVERTEKLRSINNKLYDEISKHEKTEELLRESQEYINSIINSMPSILIGITPQAMVTHWNSGAENATNVHSDRALGQPLAKVYPDLPVKMETIASAIHDDIAKISENIQMPDGSYIDVSVFPLVSKKLSGAVIRIDDVTMRIQLENMMIQTEKMMSLGEMAAGTAHEINNPLSAILQSTQTIQRRLSGELKKNEVVAKRHDISLAQIRGYLEEREIFHFLDNIQEGGERASHIVKNMLEFARADSRDLAMTNIQEVIEHALELADSSFKVDVGIAFAAINLETDFAEDLPSINCSGAEIQQVVLNLLRNACQVLHEHPPENQPPTIYVRTRYDDNYVVIEVEDNGPGIPEQARRHIFEPFFTTKEVGAGTGLGLSVSYFIVTEHHGGTIEVDSPEGGGARFTIRLPRF